MTLTKANLAISGVLLGIIGLGGWFVSVKLAPQQPISGLLFYQDGEIVAQGEIVYGQFCSSCHGADLAGEENWQSRDDGGYLPAPPHDETGHTWHHNDELLFGITKFGTQFYAGNAPYKTRMIGYEDLLSDPDIIAVLSYIKSQWPQDIQLRHDQMNKLYFENLPQ